MSDRENPLKTYLSDDEDRALDDLSDKMGMSRSSFCRVAVLNFMIEADEKVCRLTKITSRFSKGRK